METVKCSELSPSHNYGSIRTGQSTNWNTWQYPVVSDKNGNVVNAGNFTASKGVTSLASNSLPVVAITVGLSPFNWTNNSGKNIFVFIDRNSASTISVNGSKILSSTGDATIPLQNGEWVTVVYTNAPEMKWKPF
jgi:hypothetical protein